MEKTECIDYIKQAFELKEAKNYKYAIEMLYKALELENDNVEILSQIGELYFLMNNYSRAIQYCEKTLQINPEHFDTIKIMKTINERQGNSDEALSLAKHLFERFPNEDTLKDLVKILAEKKDFAQIDGYRNSEYFTPDIKLFCANTLYVNNEKEKAKELLSECDYSKEETLLLAGKIKFDENDLDGAMEIFEKTGKNTQNAEILNYKGLFELEKMNFVEAIKDFSKAIQIDKNNSKYCYNLGTAYFYNGWLEEAQKAYQKALYISPENIDYRYSLACLYYEKKEYPKAKKEAEAILEVMPGHSQTRVLKALLLANKKDLIGAQEILEENIKNGYDDDYTKSTLSKIYTELSNFTKAEKLTGEILEKNPENITYLGDLAEIYTKKANYDKALELVQKILEQNPNYIFGYILGAKIAYAKGDYDLVKGYAGDALSLDINCAAGYYYLSLAREKENDIDEAIECMKRAILYDLTNAEYYRKMCEYYQLKKDYKAALDYITEAVNISPTTEYKYIYSELVKINRKNKSK